MFFEFLSPAMAGVAGSGGVGVRVMPGPMGGGGSDFDAILPAYQFFFYY